MAELDEKLEKAQFFNEHRAEVKKKLENLRKEREKSLRIEEENIRIEEERKSKLLAEKNERFVFFC